MAKPDLSDRAVAALARASLNPHGRIPHSLHHATASMLSRRGYVWRGQITGKGIKAVRELIPTLPEQRDPASVRSEAEKCFSDRGRRPVPEVRCIYATRVFTATDGRQIRVKGVMQWMIGSLVCPPECPERGEVFSTVEEAMEASDAHRVRHDREERGQLLSEPLHPDIAKGFLGGESLPPEDDPSQERTYVVTHPWDFDVDGEFHFYPGLEAVDPHLGRALHVYRAARDGVVTAVWEINRKVDAVEARSYARKNTPDYGIVMTRMGMVRVDGTLLSHIVWSES